MNTWVLMEAIHSTALSHEDDCDCMVCRAAGGDKEAFRKIVLAATLGEGIDNA